jgi:hypothetical protein
LTKYNGHEFNAGRYVSGPGIGPDQFDDKRTVEADVNVDIEPMCGWATDDESEMELEVDTRHPSAVSMKDDPRHKPDFDFDRI